MIYFLPFWTLNVLAAYGRSKNNTILICVPKINEGLAGLKQHEGESFTTDYTFLCEPNL